ncbi:hypothetical protein SDRG_08046 [Saprolegnia diclina VS20]|uniref:Uncharacterized protein n=1 Tax=Saprolegnia diclina (strain VS20) TaxID=1156394 RepID=T0Q8P3_SAPDV|nr:hypothetical protein SDRG_08046 [Saprolegnia diclina VS20]EQC34274.1 hypothetical protein SDRG_08046 [Saprolegnia diclina VS20]|eukprot:XP_008612136.1 hypothetical protein SDRG_08046 [Saprolegnia diclina VS20]
MLGRSLAVAPSAPSVEHLAPSRSQWALAIAGVAYLVISLGIGLWYLSLLSPSLANDLWWAGFTPTGGEALLIDLVNAQLALVAASTVNIYAADATMQKLYNMSTAGTSVSPTYARRAILGELTSIEYAVPQLRTVSGSWSMRINVQHCWVDFNKTFEMAHTDARQRRCERFFATNGAVYIEAILRNVIWTDFQAIWGGDDAPFTVAIQLALEETAIGQAFLNQVSTARASTTIQDEILYWQNYKLDRFELQWQNRWQVGITETIFLENAIGMRQLVTIKNLPRLTGPWTSLRLFWIPLNDLWNLHDMNRSLVRGSSRDFRANLSTALPAMDLEVFIGETSVSGQFFNQAALFRTTVGPFESIDLVYKSLPQTSVQAFVALRQRLVAAPGGHDLLTALPRIAVELTPLGWRSFGYYGGDPACTALPRTTYVQQSFDFFYDCSKPKPLMLVVDPLLLVLARVATASQPIQDICAVASPAAACIAATTATDQLLESFALDWNTSVANEIGLNIGLMQYATAANGSWVVLKQPLLEPSFAFFGYVFLFDWVLGNREVVSFQGDNGNLTLISNAYSPQLYTTGTQPLQSATQILYYLVVATSVILVGVGGIALVYAAKTRLRFNGLNLFFFNRIVGAVWIGRPLAFLRGASAILLLSSANASLETSSSGASRFVATPRSWLEAIVVTGEATWLTYVANDVLVLVTQDQTQLYSSMASLLVWLILLVLDVASPIAISGDLQRHCSGVQLDYGLACTSGVVSTGSSTRVATILLVQGSAITLSSMVGSLRRRSRPAKAKVAEASLLVNGIAQAFARTALGTTDTQYVLDHVACVLAGLLPIDYKGVSYTFDVKLWLLLKDHLSTTQATKVLRRPKLVYREAPSGPLFDAPHANDVQTNRRHSQAWTFLCKLMGLSYVASSIVGSISYLTVSEVNLANDVYWATFNTTGAHAFIANWLNEQLVIGNTTMIDLPLDRPSINAMASFASSTALVASPANYGAYLQHTLLSSIEATIEGLRRSNGCDAPWIFSPRGRWPTRSSAKRGAIL